MNQSLRQEAVLLSLSMMYIEHILQSLCVYILCATFAFCFCLLFRSSNTVHFLLLSLKLMYFVLCMYREIDGDKD